MHKTQEEVLSTVSRARNQILPLYNLYKNIFHHRRFKLSATRGEPLGQTM